MTGRLPIWLVAVAPCLAILGAGADALAQAPQVEVQVDRPVVSVGDSFWVTISVQSETGGAAVSLPPGSPFQLVQHGGTSSSFQIRSGFGMGTMITRTETTRWQVRCIAPGRHVIGPLVVRLGGAEYRLGAASVEVVQGPAPAAPAGPVPGGRPPLFPPPFGFPTPDPVLPDPMAPLAPPAPEPPTTSPSGLPGRIDVSELDGAVYDPELFLRTVVEPSDAYVGQQVVMTVYIYTTLDLTNVNVTREASTDGFWAEDLLGPTRRLEFEDQIVGAQRFRVAVLRRVALFPLREGRLTVGAPQLEARTVFSSLFSRRAGSVTRSGIEVPVRVRALPSKGRPPDFHAGNVGRFTITAGQDRGTVAVGEPVTVTVTVRGEGNLRNVKAPPLPELVDARVYDPRVRDSVAPTAGTKVVTGERSWEYLIMPQKVGALRIPEVSLTYFDPVAASYETKRTSPLTVEVTGSANGGAAGGGEEGASDQVGGRESFEAGPLRSIRRRSSLSTGRTPLHEAWWLLLVALAAPVGFFALVVAQTARRRRAAAAGATKSRRAAPRARRVLASAAGAGGNEGYAVVARAVHGFLADRFGETAAGLTTAELIAWLLERGAAEDAATAAASLLEACERARYAPGSLEPEGLRALVDRAEALIASLDRMVVDAPRREEDRP